MKRAFSFFHFHRHGPELLLQFFRQATPAFFQPARQNRFGQVRPLVASRNIMQTSIFACRVVQPYPTSEMGQRRGSCPVGIILMPRHHSSVPCRLAEKLVVPETHRPAEQLRRRQQKRRIPQQVMKPGQHAPRAQRMKQYTLWVGRLDRKSTRLNSSHSQISYAVFCLKKKKNEKSADAYTIEGSTYAAVCRTASGAPNREGAIPAASTSGEPAARSYWLSSISRCMVVD